MHTVTCLNIGTAVTHLASGRFTSGPYWMHKPMYHDGNFEIIIVIQGTLYLQVDDAQYELNEHDVLALPPYHHLHGYQVSPEDTQYFWFHFFIKPGGMNIRQVSNDTSITALYSKKTAVLPRTFHLDAVEREFVLANEIQDILANQYFTMLGVDYLLTVLIIQLSEDYRRQIAGPPLLGKAARIESIKNWIRANLSETLRVHDVAEAFTLNPHYLVRIFKQQAGETVIHYINRLKLEQARELLVRSDLPIKQIASMSFYPNEKRLMKIFKRDTNLTPSEYRRAYTQQFLDSSTFDPEIPIIQDVDDYRRRFTEASRVDDDPSDHSPPQRHGVRRGNGNKDNQPNLPKNTP